MKERKSVKLRDGKGDCTKFAGAEARLIDLLSSGTRTHKAHKTTKYTQFS